jgi:hypothetical protein
MSSNDKNSQKPDDKATHKPNKGNEGARQPDPETLGTTDPQEHMKGPVSSLMQKAKEGVAKNDEEDRQEVEKEPGETVSKHKK